MSLTHSHYKLLSLSTERDNNNYNHFFYWIHIKRHCKIKYKIFLIYMNENEFPIASAKFENHSNNLFSL